MKKTYLLTGATSGIGKAVCENLLEAGHKVIALVRSEKSKLPQGVEKLVADMADTASVEKAFKGFKTPLDGLVNAAGILPGKSFAESTSAQLEELFSANVIAPMLIVKAVEPLLKNGGVVVLFGSISGHKGSYDDGYAASKGAVHSLVRSLATKLAPKCRVVGVAPGMTQDTRMTDELVAGRFEHNLKLIPLQQAGRPEDIAALVEFVLSDACRFMTGNVIDINGGQYLRT